MTGIIALQGGGPFTANDDLDRRLLAAVGATHVVVLPTADAYEHPQRLVDAAGAWGERLGVSVEGLMVLTRRDALDDAAAAVVRAARAVYLVGDQQLHLRAVVKDTPLWEAIAAVPASGGLLVGVGGSASALCDPMVDPRGGAFTLGLGLVRGLAFVSDAETYSVERMQRTESLADTALAEAPKGSALVRTGDAWERVGDVEVRGELG
jgi:cyanophycinase